MSDLGRTLKEAREAAGLSLSGMARRVGYSRSHLGNVENGIRQPTPALIRAYEGALGDDVERRNLLIGIASGLVSAAVPDVAIDVVRGISVGRRKLLSTVQTSHETDKVIGSLVARQPSNVGYLLKWMKRGSPVLRVNSAGILAKIGSSTIDNDVVSSLRLDREARDLYLTAVVSRVLAMPWNDAGQLVANDRPLTDPAQVQAFAAEICNGADSGARWCSTLILARTRPEEPQSVDRALREALRKETSRENLRAIGSALAGLDPLML